MAVKKVYTVTDEILHDTCEMFGQSGFMNNGGLFLIDIDQLAQYLMEDVAKQKDELMCTINYTDLYTHICETIEIIKQKLIVETMETAISDIEDDEELELIGGENHE